MPFLPGDPAAAVDRSSKQYVNRLGEYRMKLDHQNRPGRISLPPIYPHFAHGIACPAGMFILTVRGD
ncbi:MAG: hypothetical protein H0T12_09575 [Actinobacteria bacterium]|nr:hypothetical protein [Actinomycetota bacterium]